MKTVFIYTLTDPRNGGIRYVGKTTNMKGRFSGHVTFFRHRCHRTNWLKGLKEAGLEPIMEELERLENPTDCEWKECERFWIAYLRWLGFKLVNSTAGGDSGYNPSAESRAKRSASLKIAWAARKANHPAGAPFISAEHRSKIGNANRGLKRSAYTIRKRIETAKRKRRDRIARGLPPRKPYDELTVEKFRVASAARVGVPLSQELIERREATRKANREARIAVGLPPQLPITEETRQRVSESAKRAWQRRYENGTDKGKPRSLESRKRMSAAQLRFHERLRANQLLLPMAESATPA